METQDQTKGWNQTMILAEKIALLRRRCGLSQEELADRMQVSRQSVSKWESGTSIPDLEKILRLSALFGVSTDFLLKDELDERALPDGPGPDADPDAPRTLTAEEADACLTLYESVSGRIAAAVAALILSPAPFLALMSGAQAGQAREDLAAGVGFSVLLVIVAAAVAVLVLTGMQLARYEYLEKEPFQLAYGVEGVLLRRKEELEPAFRVSVTIGVVLFILSLAPILLAAGLGASDPVVLGLLCLLLALVALGVAIILRVGLVCGCLNKLLQRGDYTPENKRLEKRLEPFTGAYWCAVTAGYLLWSFLSMRWGFTWLGWPVAAVAYAALRAVLQGVLSRR